MVLENLNYRSGALLGASLALGGSALALIFEPSLREAPLEIIIGATLFETALTTVGGATTGYLNQKIFKPLLDNAFDYIDNKLFNYTHKE